MKTLLISTLISVFFLAFLCIFSRDFSLVVMAVLLALLEITLSLDNAVLNVKTLMKMPVIWQKRFLYYGLPIAVFGMRLIFPLLIVSWTTSFTVIEVIQMAIHSPQEYSQALHSGMPLISGFGGSFLLMVFFNFLMEKFHLSRFLQLAGSLIIVLTIGLALTVIMHSKLGHSFGFLKAYTIGVGVNSAFQLLAILPKILKTSFISNGLLGFLYLEVLDASFSFDGVLGAFAITQQIFVIMIGLGIGALFVRSFTLWMLENQTLQKWKYLNEGAHYAVLFLGVCILIENFYHIPEFLIALISIFIIGLSMGLSRIKRT